MGTNEEEEVIVNEIRKVIGAYFKTSPGTQKQTLLLLGGSSSDTDVGKKVCYYGDVGYPVFIKYDCAEIDQLKNLDDAGQTLLLENPWATVTPESRQHLARIFDKPIPSSSYGRYIELAVYHATIKGLHAKYTENAAGSSAPLAQLLPVKFTHYCIREVGHEIMELIDHPLGMTVEDLEAMHQCVHALMVNCSNSPVLTPEQRAIVCNMECFPEARNSGFPAAIIADAAAVACGIIDAWKRDLSMRVADVQPSLIDVFELCETMRTGLTANLAMFDRLEEVYDTIRKQDSANPDFSSQNVYAIFAAAPFKPLLAEKIVRVQKAEREKQPLKDLSLSEYAAFISEENEASDVADLPQAGAPKGRQVGIQNLEPQVRFNIFQQAWQNMTASNPSIGEMLRSQPNNVYKKIIDEETALELYYQEIFLVHKLRSIIKRNSDIITKEEANIRNNIPIVDDPKKARKILARIYAYFVKRIEGADERVVAFNEKITQLKQYSEGGDDVSYGDKLNRWYKNLYQRVSKLSKKDLVPPFLPEPGLSRWAAVLVLRAWNSGMMSAFRVSVKEDKTKKNPISSTNELPYFDNVADVDEDARTMYTDLMNAINSFSDVDEEQYSEEGEDVYNDNDYEDNPLEQENVVPQMQEEERQPEREEEEEEQEGDFDLEDDNNNNNNNNENEGSSRRRGRRNKRARRSMIVLPGGYSGTDFKATFDDSLEENTRETLRQQFNQATVVDHLSSAMNGLLLLNPEDRGILDSFQQYVLQNQTEERMAPVGGYNSLLLNKGYNSAEVRDQPVPLVLSMFFFDKVKA